VGGINLDMVGEDQNQTGSSWLIERPPDAAASYAAELLACLRDEMPGLKGMTGIAPSHTGIGGYPLYRQAEVPFSGGSDHFILSDPSVDVPTPMLIQWPDRFYHTAADTPDRTDPQSLARSGALAAMYTYWLAVAEAPQATWLGYQMAARGCSRQARQRCLRPWPQPTANRWPGSWPVWIVAWPTSSIDRMRPWRPCSGSPPSTAWYAISRPRLSGR
jgi:hypothetical protein